MKLDINGDVFTLEASYSERAIPKRLGFRWHRTPGHCDGRCAACLEHVGQCWWTDMPEVARKLEHVATPSAGAAIAALLAEIEASRADNVDDVSEFNTDVPSPDGLDYLPYQRAGIRYAIPRRATLIGDEMGLGKTIQAIGLMNAMPKITRVMVVCPPSLRTNWSREIEKWTVLGWHIHVINKEKDLTAIDTPTFSDAERRVFIFSYNRVGGKRNLNMGKRLMSIRWDLMIADEIHYCKNDKAQRTKGVLGEWNKDGTVKVPGLIHVCRKLVFLTGTPITNRPVELFPLARALDPDGLGRSFIRFARRYCNGQLGRWGWDFSGASNLGELQDTLRARFMIRRLKKDVLKDLPAKRRQILPLDPDGHEKVIKQQADAFAKHDDVMTQLQEAQAMAMAMDDAEAFKEMGRLLRDARKIAFKELARERKNVAIAKIPAVIEHIKEALDSTNSSILVFAHHKAVVKALQEAFDTPLVITGDTPTDKRQGIVDRFQSGDHRVFIGNIQAAGVGLTLTAGDLVIFAELDWTPANMMQAEDRAHRIGQTNPVLVQYLVFDGSVDSKMVKTLLRKMEVIEQALDTRDGKAAEEMELMLQAEQKRAIAKGHKYPVASQDQRDAAAKAMQSLAAVCDGANERDGAGFNGGDTRFGKELAARSVQRALTDGEVAAATKLAQRYHRQLNVELLAILVVAEAADVINLIGE